jgi:hypothetical protein
LAIENVNRATFFAIYKLIKDNKTGKVSSIYNQLKFQLIVTNISRNIIRITDFIADAYLGFGQYNNVK